MQVSGQHHARPLYPQGENPGTQWIEGWVDPGAVLDAVEKRKIHSAHRKSSPRTPIFQSIASRYTDWATPALAK
jgi:hypothetical protein